MQQIKVLQRPLLIRKDARRYRHSKGDFAMMDAAFVKMTTLAIVLVSCVVMVQPY